MVDSNASFIPKNTQRIQKRVRTTYRIYLLSYLSYVFFFGTLIAVIGVYFYAIQVQNNLESVKADLESARLAFSAEDIEGVRSMEKRLLVANQLLNQMAAPSRIFTELEKIVADNVKFIRFSYEALPNQQAKITLTGKADHFNQILYQRDLMNSSLLFADAPSITFDYAGSALGGETAETEATPEITDDVMLTFVVNNDISTSIIPYQPVADTSANQVTEVRSTAPEATGTEPQAEVVTEATSTEAVDDSN